MPANAAATQFVSLNSVSCAAAGDCTAVGTYDDGSGDYQGLVLVVSQTTTQATTTALVSSPDPSVPGQAVTYTARVSPAPGGGTVSFADNGSPIAGCGSQPVDTSTGQATCTTTPATAGAHNIVAIFSGTGTYAGSTSATATQVVTSTSCASLAGCNLSGLNLSGAQLAGANLKGATLTGADLAGANLSGATSTRPT